MKKYILLEGKLFMDKFYGEEANEALEEDLKVWSHKDKVKNVFAVIEKDEYDYCRTMGIDDTDCKYISPNKESAIEALNEYNE